MAGDPNSVRGKPMHWNIHQPLLGRSGSIVRGQRELRREVTSHHTHGLTICITIRRPCDAGSATCSMSIVFRIQARAWKYRQFLLYALRVHEEDCLDGSGNIHQFMHETTTQLNSTDSHALPYVFMA
ncbi:hypothetical protein D6C89_07789 [Aureobasidium pullulans]|nr:hypothetical protein D6C89_07789 [Aureobasidium pullulans]